MASSSEAEEGKAPAEAGSPNGEEPAVPAMAEGKKKKKKKMRRFTQQQIDSCIESGEPFWQPVESNAPPLMDCLTEEDRAKYSQEFIDRLAAIDALREPAKAKMLELQEKLRKERQDILDQYYAKGYAEYEVDEDDDDDDEEPAVPRALRPGRRRFRRGLVRRAAGGTSKRLN